MRHLWSAALGFLTCTCCAAAPKPAAQDENASIAKVPQVTSAPVGTMPAPDVNLRCRPAALHCADTLPKPGKAITTDSMPLGSILKAQRRGDPTAPSRYPTSPGSGGMVSGESGSPTRAEPGPTNGIGR
ncbi:hypothetical protein E4K72_17000 [Oxalobacteraceae bacterium OM1]|nr:hypothetical protein E4K72_17000 [Oxalobacteraceae bacterium OM1]